MLARQDVRVFSVEKPYTAVSFFLALAFWQRMRIALLRRLSAPEIDIGSPLLRTNMWLDESEFDPASFLVRGRYLAT